MTRMIENVKDSFDFKMAQLLTKEMPASLKTVVSDYNMLLSRMVFESTAGESFNVEFYQSDAAEYEAKLEEYKANLVKETPEWVTEECAKFGVESPSDVVTLHVDLGSVLYDLCSLAVPVPAAPLAQALRQKKLMDYASELSKDEFTIIEEYHGLVEAMLMDDEAWGKCSFAAWAETEKGKSSLVMGSNGLLNFRKVTAALLAAFLPEPEVEPNPTQVTNIGKASEG